MWRCASASRRERATVYELRIYHAALVFGRSIEPRARGEIPAADRPRAAPLPRRRHIATWTCDIVGAFCPLRPRQAAPLPDPSGFTAAAGPVESPDRRPPRPAAIISRRSSDGVRRRPRQLVTRARHGHDRRGHQRDSPRTERGHSRHHFPRPAPLPHSRRRATITHSGHTFTLDSALKPLSFTLSPLLYHSRVNRIHSALSYSLTRTTHSHSLTQTHPLTHSHASTHSHSLEVRVDAQLTRSR